jgi:periplasmic mercuric ion binding protein
VKRTIRAALLSLGLVASAQAAEKTETLKVDGWHSSGDAYKTEQAVRSVKGVMRASADKGKGEVTVTYDDAHTSRAAIEKAVAGAGYSVKK